ncbi:MAG: DMT family transporter [Beijerinckiaceae bacterium]|nr:DMT family transporter [Beijerinckiaceae bacterium]
MPISTPSKPATADQPSSPWLAALPVLFVFFWATGFIGGKYGLPHAGTFTFLTLRFLIVIALLTVIALAMGAPWPKRHEILPLAIGGVFVHAAYLGSVFLSISNGVEAGVSAMMAGLQPLLTAMVAGPVLGEKVTGRQWAGLLLGVAGVALVVETKLAQGLGTPLGMAFAFLAAIMLTIGTLWQKKFGGQMDLRTGSIVQFTASAIVCAPLAIFLEDFRHEWTVDFVLALGWLVVVLSIGTISALYVMIRRGAASKVASLFFLVPPMTALLAYFLFGETLGLTAFAGMVLIAVAVAMVTITPGKT